MGLGTEVRDLRTSEHRENPEREKTFERPASVASGAPEAVAAIKRELAAILIVGAVGLFAAGYWLEGARELAVLAGYGIGAALWIHARARGLVHAARGRARTGPDGA